MSLEEIGNQSVLFEKNGLTEEQFSKIFEACPNAVIMTDSLGTICLVNQEAEQLFGYSREELVGKKTELLLPERFHKANPLLKKKVISNSKSNKAIPFFDLFGLKKNGTEVPIELILSSLIIKDENFILSSIIDITAHVKTEEKIFKLQQEQQFVINSMNEGLHGIDLSGKITFLNPAASSMLGWEGNDLIGKSAHKMIHHSKQDGNTHLEKDCPILKTLKDGQIRKSRENEVFWRKDGTFFLVEYSISPILDLDSNIKGVLVSFIDCTDKVANKEELDKFSDLSPHMMCIMDYQGNFTRINPAWFKTLGYNQEDLLGKTVYDYVHPEDLSIISADMDHIKRKGEVNALEIRLKHSSGDFIWTLWSIVSDMKQKKIFGIGRDITDNKHQEKELIDAKEKAESADYLKSAFLAIMSHELRTPLNSIIGFTSIINSGLAGPVNEEQKKQLTMVLKSSKHLLNLINDVLDISKIEAGQLEVEQKSFDLLASINRAIDIVKPLLDKKGLQFIANISPDLGVVKSDQRRLEQVIINLLTNAVKFTESGSVSLIAEKKEHYITIQIIDTGEGITEENLALLFVPFKQVNGGISRPQEGTGLGLSICDKIMKLLGGDIVVKSEFGKGSVFEVQIPN